MTKTSLGNAGISNISWTEILAPMTVTTTEDIYKAQRPEGTNTRYWGEFPTVTTSIVHGYIYRVTYNGTVYDNLMNKFGYLKQGTGSLDPNDPDSEGSIGGSHALLGNRHLYDSRYGDTGEPFCLLFI